MTTTVRRLGLMAVALCAALTMTVMSVSAQQSGVIYPTGGAVPSSQGTTYVPDPYANATNGALTGPPAGYFTSVGCDVGNYSCLAANGGVYPYGVYGGYPGYGSYPGYGGYPSYPGYGSYPGQPAPNVAYPGAGLPPGGAPQTGYAMNYNFNFRYYGIPDAYFTSNGCAVGDYTCLFSKFGNGAMVPASFFAAVGCATNDYNCATSQTVFTNAGCTIGNYTCVYMKTGKNP